MNVSDVCESCFDLVTTCLRAADVLSMLRDNEARFDVLMAEIQMHEMNGLQLLAEIVKLNIKLPVIREFPHRKRLLR